MARHALLFLFCAPALAQQLLTPGEQVIKELRSALERQDEARAESLLAEVGGLYRYPASPDEAKALLKVAGQATHAKSGAIVLAALRALGETGAPKAAPHLKRFLQSAEPEQMVAAVQAAGRIRAESLIPRLRELARKSADLTVADQSLVALSEFFRSPAALRKKVTDSVLADCQTLSRNRRRWTRLRAPALRALQRLTGRKLNSVTHFAVWWKVARTRKDPFAQ